MSETSIQWTDRSINPILARDLRVAKPGQTKGGYGSGVGHYCEKISPGCALCYASTSQRRFGTPAFPGHQKLTGLNVLQDATCDTISWSDHIEVFFSPDRLREVLTCRKPSKFFWCDQSDMFGEWVPTAWIDRCFAAMALTPQHTHQVLTKRPERMAEYLDRPERREKLHEAAKHLAVQDQEKSDAVIDARRRLASRFLTSFVLPNIWLGCSVENQEQADKRIPHLIRCPAAVRFLSVEPLLGPVDLSEFVPCAQRDYGHDSVGLGIHWVIAGGESGPGARPCDVEWIRSVVQQCKAAAVPCFVKQIGAKPFIHCGQCGKDIGRGIMGGFVSACGPTHAALIAEMIRVNDSKGGDETEWPEDLRVREFPKVAWKL